MPRKSQSSSQSQGRNQTQHSQRSTQLTQYLITEENPATIDDLANDCVRYIVQKGGQKSVIRKADLQKYVIPNVGRNFDPVIGKTCEILRNVYGFNFILCDAASSNKIYVLSNSLPYITDTEEEQDEVPEDVNKILLLLILAHLFMSENVVGEASLSSFLESFNVEIERRHPLFGNVKEYITTLVKQQYLSVETDPISKKASYKWGSRSEKEISKHAILKFVCKMYNDCAPNIWTNQFQNAEEQPFENLPQEDSMVNGTMEVEESD